MSAFIHPTAILESGVVVGSGSSVWDHVHIRRNTNVGDQCIIGEKTHISYDVRIGNLVKINAFVYICTAVTIEDGVMISAGCIFTNDRYPRAATADLTSPLSSEPNEDTRPTLVRSGATIGAGAVVGCGITIGTFAMVGMGSVVTRSVPDHYLVVGNPARPIAFVCRCGQPFARVKDEIADGQICQCVYCSRKYVLSPGSVSELYAD